MKQISATGQCPCTAVPLRETDLVAV